MTCKDCIHYFVCSFSGGEIYPSEESIKADCDHFVASNEMERINKNMDAMVIEHHRLLADTKADTVRKMQERAKKRLDMYSHIHRYAEEAKEVTEEYANGDPVEMVSVWDACRLEHNGYDDYETMCKLQENIENIAKSRLLREIEVDIDQIAKEMLEGE